MGAVAGAGGEAAGAPHLGKVGADGQVHRFPSLGRHQRRAHIATERIGREHVGVRGGRAEEELAQLGVIAQRLDIDIHEVRHTLQQGLHLLDLRVERPRDRCGILLRPFTDPALFRIQSVLRPDPRQGDEGQRHGDRYEPEPCPQS